MYIYIYIYIYMHNFRVRFCAYHTLFPMLHCTSLGRVRHMRKKPLRATYVNVFLRL